MIIDKIKNAKTYINLSPRLTTALEFLAKADFSKKENGRYDIDGDNIYYLVQRYATKPIEEGRLEAHKKYIDIQFVAQGEENMGYCTVYDGLAIETPYNMEKDVMFYKRPDKLSFVGLYKGMFSVLFPDDAHMPQRQIKGPSEVLKVVVKVKTE